MAELILEGGLSGLAFARNVTLGFVEDIPDDKLCHQVSPKANHVLWTLGHLAFADQHFLTGLGDGPDENPPDWADKFGIGSTPSPNAADYPSKDELLSIMSDRRAELIAWFESMSTEKLRSPLPEDFADFAVHYAGLASTLAWHEGMHAGQIAVIRQDLGLGRKFA
ncbi:MAG: DinB family protein [Planctomycetes bacterium]|nr:DinB family protein [Planctomycetota bacterium]